MVVWHHQLNRHETQQTPGDEKGQGGLACYSPWGCRESDMTEQTTTNFRYIHKYISKKKTITNSSVHLTELHQVTN